MRIAVTDDHPLYLEALSGHLRRLRPEAEVLCFSTFEGLSLALRQTAFDLLIVDYHLPDTKEHCPFEAVIAKAPKTPVIVISGSASQTQILKVIEAGARGYIPKTMDENLLDSVLELVMNGGTYVPADILKPAAETSSIALLSESEKAILRMVTLGSTNKEIARNFDISEAAVKFRVSHIFQKLNVKNRAQAASLAIANGLG